ncbi:hypothetical protein BGW41_008329 [Actinomortierella wolfii]|nr:hypothetical protein BGW41_008329 [Actinomortierella wolfii]
MSGGGYIGSKISLISRSDIRYVGILHHLNPTDSTVALEQVRSYGTEGRRGNPAEEIPPSDNVYEYIVFRGSDVKDLHVCEPPAPQPPRPQVPDDPAIVATTAPYAYQGQQGYYQQPSQQYYQAPPQPQPQPAVQPAPPVSVPQEAQAPVPPASQPPAPEADDSETIKPAPPPAKSAPKTAETQELRQSVEKLAKQVSELNVTKQSSEQEREGELKQSNRLPGMGGHLTHNNRRGGRGHRGGVHGQANNRTPAVPTSDFDFETANAKFHKEDLLKEVVAKSEDQAEKEDEVVIPQAEEFYDKKKSFFDNISCETKERMSQAENKGHGRLSAPERRAKQSEERQLNMETFGQASVDSGRFRGGFRGGYRGGGYRGGQRGGYYRGGHQGGSGYGGGRGGYHHRSGGYAQQQVQQIQQQQQARQQQ